MQCYTELTPATAVTHAVSLPFLSSKANNLVVAKTSVLQIFELKTVSTEAEDTANGELEISSQDVQTDNFNADLALHRLEQTCKLVLVSEHTLSGTVISLKRVKTLNTKAGGETVLIAFKEAKLSLVEWDPEICKICTISVHYYEGESLQPCPWAPELSLCQNYLTVDPNSRCAALKFGQRHLAILPFRQIADDLGDDDFDADMEDAPDHTALARRATNGDIITADQTPYNSSFVLSLTVLDPTLTHPVHLAFLHEYREPTFGIMSSSHSLGSSLLQERKDSISYTVFTLDIEQRASTTILSISGLPNDLYEVVPLPLPVGGALLLGTNEVVHVDEAGKTNAIAVNEFAKQVTSFGMVDHSELDLRLEGCLIQQLGESGDVLIVLKTGQLAILTFSLEGRSVLGLQVHKVAVEKGGSLLLTGVSCFANLSRGKIFLGSDDADAVILGWSKKPAQMTRKRSHTDMVGEDAELSLDEDMDDDDDIYGNDEPVAPQANRTSDAHPTGPDSYMFRIHDRLPNYAPIGEITLGDPSASLGEAEETPYAGTLARAELLYPTGRGTAGGIVILTREIDPIINARTEILNAKAIWSIHPKRSMVDGEKIQGSEDQLSVDAEFDEYIVASRLTDAGNEESTLYSVAPKGIEEISKEDFDPEAGATIEIGTLAGGTKIVQVLREEVKCYDAEFSLEQIIPASDETTGVELKNIGASFRDPYLLLLRDDSSITIHHVNTSGDGELEELERGDGILSSQWLSASVFKSSVTMDKTLAFCLTAEGGLRIFELPNLETAVYASHGLAFVLPTVTEDFVPRRNTAKESLTEIIVADLGDETAKSLHLIVRTKNDDLVIYAPFHYPLISSQQSQSFTKNLRFRKISQPHLAKYSEESELESATSGRESLLRRVDNVGGYSTVFQCGTSPCFVLKEASSAPRVLGLKGKAIRGVAGFHTAEVDRGFIGVNVDGAVRMCQFRPQSRYGDTGWATQKINLREEVQQIRYLSEKKLFAIGTNERVEFKLPEDDYHQEWAREDTSFLPSVDQGTIKLIYPVDWSIIDTYPLEPKEVILSMEILNLEGSEATHKRQPYLCVGTAIVAGEDLPTKGSIYVFAIIDVVPELDRPWTGQKLKLIVREEVKGAVSALSEIGTEGFLMMAQGQKILVRGLKEDNTLLPVAFMDVQTYVTVAKALKGTGMVVLGDIAKGVWFGGYTEDPYRMALFGKGRSRMEVISAEFLPHAKQLYIIVADGDSNLHVLQYDPEHPKSLQGQRLLHKSTFHIGHFPISIILLPSSLTPPAPISSDTTANGSTESQSPEDTKPLPKNQLLVTTQTGSLGLLTPINEQQYRRLGALQTYLTNQLDNACGLNPKGYRAAETERFGSRGVVDGTLLLRWCELSTQRRQEALGKVGVEEWVLRGDFEDVGGGGLGYL